MKTAHEAVRVAYPERGDYDWYDALVAYAEVGHAAQALRLVVHIPGEL